MAVGREPDGTEGSITRQALRIEHFEAGTHTLLGTRFVVLRRGFWRMTSGKALSLQTVEFV